MNNSENDHSILLSDTAAELDAVKELYGDEFDRDGNRKSKKKKRHIAAKILIALLIILLVFEAVVIGAKLIAPDSTVAIEADKLISGVIEWFSSLGK